MDKALKDLRFCPDCKRPMAAERCWIANYSSLTAAVDFGTVITTLVAVAAVIVGILVARKGIRFVLGMLR